MRHRDHVLLALCLVMCGCRDSRLPRCATLPDPPRVRACVTQRGEALGFSSRQYSFTGTVTDVSGANETTCISSTPEMPTPNVTVISLEDAAGVVYDLAYQAPPTDITWAVGDTLEVDYSFRFGGFTPTVANLTVRRGGLVELYVGEGGAVRDLTGGPLAYERGAAICEESDECGSWSRYDLEVVHDSDRVAVPYGESVAMAGYTVVHGGLAATVSTDGHCNDWGVSAVEVAVFRRPGG